MPHRRVSKNVSRLTGKIPPPPIVPLQPGNLVAPESKPRIRPIHLNEIDQALKLYFADSPDNSRLLQEKVESFKRLARRQQYDLSRQMVVHCDNKIVAACLFIPQPGRNALIFTSSPSFTAQDRPEMLHWSAQALRRSCLWAFRQGSTLLQALIEPADNARCRLCEKSGFRRLTDLIYMSRCPDPLPQPLHPLDQITWLDYQPAHHDLFKSVIALTYHESLDCPELENLRDMEDVIRSHKAAGHFDPHCWKLLFWKNEPAGALLLTPLPTPHTMELTYMGLCPPARGRQLGRLLLTEALCWARQYHMCCLTLAVDCRNHPALRLYRDFDFTPLFRRTVFIYSSRWQQNP